MLGVAVNNNPVLGEINQGNKGKKSLALPERRITPLKP